MTGQMSLFDLVDEDQKAEFDIPLPDVGEYEKETKLAFEKEVLGVYLSGHPMEDYEEKWRKSISHTTVDFQIDEETGRTKVRDCRRNYCGKDGEIYKNKQNYVLFNPGGSAWHSGNCGISQRL